MGFDIGLDLFFSYIVSFLELAYETVQLVGVSSCHSGCSGRPLGWHVFPNNALMSNLHLRLVKTLR